MKKIFVVIGIIFFIVLIIFFAFRGNEDYWICNDNGEWIKHGKPSYPSPVIPCGKKISLGKTKEDCLAQGGVWSKQGPEPNETCNRKAIDRGNLCRDNNECEGWCQVELTQDELKQGMSGKIKTNRKTGQCSVWVVELGCFGIMEKGKVSTICID